MKLLITGASGYVGSKLYTDLKTKFDTIGTYNSNKLFSELKKLDVTDEKKVATFIGESKPDCIIHVANNPSVGWCQKNPEKAIEINEKSTEYVLSAANKIHAKVIYISSYAVINHHSKYAQTKLASEQILKKNSEKYVILRLGHVIGYSPNTVNDRQFNRFLRNLLDGTPAVYDTSWKFQPTYLRHVSEVIQTILEKGITNEIIPIAVPEIKSRFEIAKDILTPFNIKVTAIDKRDKTPIFNESLNKLKELDLPTYIYSEMIENILSEIRINFKI